ncbi:MAG: RNA polymerase sigma factor [Peptostreptococcaceae bacterium]
MKLLSSKNKLKEKRFKEYIIENKNSFYRLAYSYVKNEDDALDIVQESICKGLAKINKLEDVNLMKPWFYRIIVNTSLDLIRKNKKYVHIEDDLENIENVESKIEIDREIDIQKAMESLPEDYKSIIILRFFEDLKISDIAQVLNENENTIKTRLYRALKLLRVEIEDNI